MTTTELASYIAPFLAPAKRIVDALPTKHTVTDFTSPATAASLAELVAHYAKPSKRTYYLGACGRVSQRKQLVGEIIATVRACNTDQARFLFSDYQVRRTYPISTPKPFIGKPVLCKCGHYHSHFNECPVCASWRGLGERGSVELGRGE